MNELILVIVALPLIAAVIASLVHEKSASPFPLSEAPSRVWSQYWESLPAARLTEASTMSSMHLGYPNLD